MRDAKEKMNVLRGLKSTIAEMKYYSDIETLALDIKNEQVVMKFASMPSSLKLIDVRDLNALGIAKAVLDNL